MPYPKIGKPTLEHLKFNDGRGLLSESDHNKLLFILVRHSGCTFCRETLAKLSESLPHIESQGYSPVVVHMGSPGSSQLLKQDFNLNSVEFISDPDRHIYKAFDARKGSLTELFGPKIWVRGFIAGVMKGHGIGMLDGDGFQLGGSYILHKRNLTPLHIPNDASDIENWEELLSQGPAA